MKVAVKFLLCFVVIGLFPLHSRTIEKGYIKRANLEYHNETSIIITPGYGDCNGNFWEVENNIIYELTSLDSQEGFIYIYVDDANSNYPLPLFYDYSGEPEFNEEKKGWYNGNDRCIGTVWSPEGQTIIKKFRKDFVGGYTFNKAWKKIILNSFPPNYWEELDIKNICPVNTISLYLEIKNNNMSASGKAIVASSNETNTIILNNDWEKLLDWIKMDNDLILKWQGYVQASFDIYIRGYQIER